MALTVNFTPSQVIGVPNSVYLTDGTTGTDAAVTARRVYITNVQGDYLVASGTTSDYTVWALVDSTKSIACLTEDTAVLIRVDWVNVSGTVLYTKSKYYPCRLYNLQESFYLTQTLTSSPNNIQDTNWFLNKMTLRVNIDDSVQAIEIGGNQGISQAALNRATQMTNNENLYF